jgi:hypothetical protein
VDAQTFELMTATASIAATLVAIIGGFLVSRVVALASERTGLQRSLHEAMDARERAVQALEAHDRHADAAELERAVWHARDLLVSTNGDVGPEALVENVDPDDYDVTPGQLLAAMKDAAAAVRQASTVLNELDDADNWPNEWQTAKKILTARGIDADPDLLREVYTEQVERRRRRQQREAEHRRRQRENPLAAAFGSNLAGLMPASAWPTNRGRSLARLVATPMRRYAPPLGRVALASAVDDAEAEIRLLRSALARVDVPPDLRFGFGVLLVFALIGIVYPIVLVGIGEAADGPAWRWGVIGLFIAGLLGVMTYLGWTAWRSTRHTEFGEPHHNSAPPSA